MTQYLFTPSATLGYGRKKVSVGGGAGGLPPLVLTGDDFNQSAQFKSWIYNLGSTAAAVIPKLAAIRTALNIGTSGALLPASTDSRYNSTTKFLTCEASGAAQVQNLDIQGAVTGIGNSNTSITVLNSRIDSSALTTGSCVRKGAANPAQVTISHCELTNGPTSAYEGYAPYLIEYTWIHDLPQDGLKGNVTGSKRIQYCMLTNLGKGAGAHGDGIQTSDGSDITMLNTIIYSALSNIVDPTYATSVGLANALRADSDLGSHTSIRHNYLGCVLWYGSGNLVNVDASSIGSTVQNFAYVNCIGQLPELALTSGSNMIYRTLDVFQAGTLENIAFSGNIMPDGSPWIYQGADVTGIWRYNPGTLDATTIANWKNFGILDAAGQPAIPIRSYHRNWARKQFTKPLNTMYIPLTFGRSI